MDKSAFQLLNFVAGEDLPDLLSTLKAEKIEAHCLHGDRVHDLATFFGQAAQDLPRAAGRGSSDDRTAFADSLSEYCHLSEAQEFAIVWSEAQNMLQGGLEDLLAIVATLTTLARQLYSPASGTSQSKVLYLFLAGTGPNFGHR